MKLKYSIRDCIAAALLALGVIFFISGRSTTGGSNDIRSDAARMERSLSRKTLKLDRYAREALSQDMRSWMSLGNVPSDIILYRYCADTLQSWFNEFPVFNDDIRPSMYSATIFDPRRNPVSPLAEVSDRLSFMSLGPKLYLVKMWRDGENKVIGGVDMQSYMSERYTLEPLTESCGTPIFIDGQPVFKIVCESLSVSRVMNATLLWVSLFLILIACMLYLEEKKTLLRYRISALAMLAVLAVMYSWGLSTDNQMEVFSPMIYAGSRVLYSLGAILLVNLAILMQSLSLYMVRDSVGRKAHPFIFLSTLLIMAYTVLTLRDIVLNSDINLEFYRFDGISKYGILTYVSYLSMLVSVPVLLQIVGIDMFSRLGRIVFPAIIAAIMVSAVGVLGLKKEQSKMEVVANRLAFGRDISLERRLRYYDPQIADDPKLASLSMLRNPESSMLNQFNEVFRNTQNYFIDVYVTNEYSNDPQVFELYSSMLRNGSPIAEGSHFLYVRNSSGHSYYAGVFMYYMEGIGMSRVLVKLESKDTRGNKGYAGIFNITPPGKTTVPSGYSFGHYSGDNLIEYRGSYAYPTRMDEQLYTQAYINNSPTLVTSGYTHLLTRVGGNELIVLSRNSIPVFRYLVIGIFMALFVFLLLSLLSVQKDKKRHFNIHNYKYRISAVILVSLSITLLVMAVVSVYFVYTRNEANMMNVMSYKINSISNMVDAGLSMQTKGSDVTIQELRDIMERTSNESNSDITLYLPSGRFFMSTSQILFRRQLIGGRINGNAYDNIVYGNRRYFLQKEKVADKTFYCMYAPVKLQNGSLIAILCSPYYDDEGMYDFQKDAFAHSFSILALFALLLLGARFLVSGLVDRMFKPLSEMSAKMTKADLDNLEPITYESQDEIYSIVQAYNRMVTELSESTRKLAQAERDKAWSGMARQVAHEIKNPLTPMKLQLQRLIRLKQKNDPSWQDRFNEASKIILDHIDILTDTANEFSSFAKLYSEEHTCFRLDDLLQEEISMFNNRDNIRIEYIGLKDVRIKGPKPQLTRVFVNLISNAVQALETSENGRIMVSLCNSADSDYYDILVEDNGSGVSDENLGKLFTPNFTTKNGGSGLGLAISRSILETCEASISYSRSFALGGACFTVRYPKMITSDGSRSEQDSL